MAVMWGSHSSLLSKSLRSIDGEVLQVLKKGKQQHSLVKVKLKVANMHTTGDETDKLHSAEMKLYRFPCVILAALRGKKVKVQCRWSQSSRKSYVTCSEGQSLKREKGEAQE